MQQDAGNVSRSTDALVTDSGTDEPGAPEVTETAAGCRPQSIIIVLFACVLASIAGLLAFCSASPGLETTQSPGDVQLERTLQGKGSSMIRATGLADEYQEHATHDFHPIDNERPASTAKSGRALLIIGVQDCFLEGGSLGVDGASRVIPALNNLREEKDCLFDLVVKSQDFHPAGHISFGATNGLPNIGVGASIPLLCTTPTSGKILDAACCPNADGVSADLQANVTEAVSKMSDNPACSQCFCFEMEQAMWPVHCLNSGDSHLAPALLEKASDIVVQTGTNSFVDAYSVFMDNTKQLKTDLDNILQAAGIKHVFVAGIAIDFCVAWSAEDAHSLGYITTVLEDASAGIGIPLPDGTDTIADAMERLTSQGIHIMNTSTLLDMPC